MAGIDQVFESSFFEHLHPHHFSTFRLKNQLADNPLLHTPFLLVRVLDSFSKLKPPLVAILIIPRGREFDPLTASRLGLEQLCDMFWSISRIFVVSNHSLTDAEVDTDADPWRYDADQVTVSEADETAAEESVRILLKPFHPTGSETCDTRFLHFPESLLYRSRCAMGRYKAFLGAGSYVLTDELLQTDDVFELRRRLRFFETGNIIHSEVLIKKGDRKIKDGGGRDNTQFDLSQILEAHNRVIWFSVMSFFNEKAKQLRQLFGLAKSSPKKLVCFGGIGRASVFFNFRQTFGGEICVADPNPLDALLLMESLGVRRHWVKILGWHPQAVLDQYNGLIEGGEPIVGGVPADYPEGFDVMIVDIQCFGEGMLYTSPPQSLLTIDSISKMKRCLKSYGGVIVNFLPSSCISFADVVNNFKVVFTKVSGVQIAPTHYVLFATTSDSPHSALEEFMKKDTSRLVVY